VSEFHVEVVEIGRIEPHPNADSLSITYVHGGYPCVVKTGAFEEGDLAAYIPVDTTVPVYDPRFAFLAKTADAFGRARIRALKLRGTFSMGLLVPASHDWALGADVKAVLGVERYEPPLPPASSGGVAERGPESVPAYTDIEGMRKHLNVLGPDELVVVTEKIHGANGRFVYADGRLYAGARTWWAAQGNNIWWRAAEAAELEQKLARAQGIAFYGEVYGRVQDLRYGLDNGVGFVAFDAFDTKTGKYLDYAEFVTLCSDLDIPRVPELYRGPYSGFDPALAEGQTVLGHGACIREGCVVRPLVERWDSSVGRVVLKYIGEGYLLR
jgi:RNA ligase (TIGR02306 family)